MRRPVLRLFNRLAFELTAAPYDWLARRPPWLEHCRELLRCVPSSSGPRRILDVGCGPGSSAIELLRAGGDRVVGLDLSGPMLARARAHAEREGLLDRLSLVRADAVSLPFADTSFDAVTGHSLLYLVHPRELALREMVRVLRPGGVLVLMEPAKGFAFTRIPALARGSPSFALTLAGWRVVSGATGRQTAASLLAELGTVGLRALRVENCLGGAGLLAVGTR